jgi:hypothetical protein
MPDSPLFPVPAVRRARGFRLYAPDGRRYLDLWQAGGAALLGHNPPHLLLTLKNAAARGLYAPLPSPETARLGKALLRWLPDRAWRWYADRHSAEAALAAALWPVRRLADFADPAARPFAGAAAGLWRPWLAPGSIRPEAAAPPLLAPVLPLPLAGAPILFALEPASAAAFPPSDRLSALTAAAAARTVFDLLAAVQDGSREPDADVAAAADASPAWRRAGLYLVSDAATDVYAARFDRYLAAGFLLPPDPAAPAILPAGLSPGEAAALRRLLAEPCQAGPSR